MNNLKVYRNSTLYFWAAAPPTLWERLWVQFKDGQRQQHCPSWSCISHRTCLPRRRRKRSSTGPATGSRSTGLPLRTRVSNPGGPGKIFRDRRKPFWKGLTYDQLLKGLCYEIYNFWTRNVIHRFISLKSQEPMKNRSIDLSWYRYIQVPDSSYNTVSLNPLRVLIRSWKVSHQAYRALNVLISWDIPFKFFRVRVTKWANANSFKMHKIVKTHKFCCSWWNYTVKKSLTFFNSV